MASHCEMSEEKIMEKCLELIYFLNGTSTLFAFFNAKIKSICKCLIVIIHFSNVFISLSLN